MTALWASSATGILTPTERATIPRLRGFVWQHSKPHRAALTAQADGPLGRVGWIGFFGIRWFTDMLEETRVLLAPSSSGKAVRALMRLIRRARGAVLATSTKTDVLELAWRIRAEQVGAESVMVFDPERRVPWADKNRVKWDIVRGCEGGQMAMKRVAAIVAARPLTTESTINGFFNQALMIVLQCMLHAAAVGGYTMRDVMLWMGDFGDEIAYRVL